MSATPLPSALRVDFEALAREARRARVVRGCGYAVVVVVGFATAAITADAVTELSGSVRGILLTVWLLLGCLVVWRLVARPAREPIRAADVSAVADSRRAVGFLAATAAASLIVLSPVCFVRGGGERVRRFLAPWYTAPVPEPGYRIVVSSGDPTIRRGEPVTLAGYLDRTIPGVPLPTSATLLVRENGAESRVGMHPAARSAFHATRPPVSGSFEYAIEAGGVVSDWHTVVAVDSVTIQEGTTIALEPPDYARGVLQPRAFAGFSDFDGPQYSRATVTVKLARPAVSAHLEWRPGDGTPIPAPFPVRFHGDRLVGTGELTLPTSGALKLVVVGDRNVRTEFPAQVRITFDEPPIFEKIVGLGSALREARPDDKIGIDLAIRDDIAVGSVQVEYRIGGSDSPIHSEAISLSGLGTPRAEGLHFFPLRGRAKEGDSISLRVRATDTRAVGDLRPQEVIYPAVGWATFKLTSSAKPLAEQEVTALREGVRNRLEAATRPTTEAATATQALDNESTGIDMLSPDHTVRLRVIQERVGSALEILDELAAELALRPDLRPLSQAVRNVANGPLRRASTTLKRVGSEVNAADRSRFLAAALASLDAARDGIDDLSRQTDRVAQSLLDSRRLASLAHDQRNLLEKPGTPEELARRQTELLARLREILAASPPLSRATDTGSVDDLHRLAAQTKSLADRLRRLDRAATTTESAARREIFQALTEKQKILAKQAANFATRLAIPARIAEAPPPSAAPFEKAAENLAAGSPLEGLTEQEKGASELDRLADALTAAAKVRLDEKEAVKQLARWQADLRVRFADAVKANPLPAAQMKFRKKFQAEQTAIRESLLRLRYPDGASPLVADRAATDRKLTRAVSAMTTNDAATTLQEAEEALTALAEALPTREMRIRELRADIPVLQRDLEVVNRIANEIYNKAERTNPDSPAFRAQLIRKLATLADDQEALLKRVESLDAPGLEHRRTALIAAARRAHIDLKEGLLLDFPISQVELRRQFLRLRSAVEGTPPVDDRASQLATLAGEVAAATSRLPANPTDDELRPIRAKHHTILRSIETFPNAEALEVVHEAQAAIAAADQALYRKNVEDMQKKAAASAQILGRLVDRLTLAESDQARVERLAKSRAEATVIAKAVGRIPSATETADAVRKVRCDTEDLEHARAGNAQQAKRKALDAMIRLRKATNPEREPILQQNAADALRALAEEMKKNGDRSEASPLPPRLGLVEEPPGSRLPTLAAADEARTLAQLQRELRDAVSKSQVELARAIAPAEKDPLADLTREQSEIAESIPRPGKQSAEPELPKSVTELLPRIRETADQAAAELQAGGIASGLGHARSTELYLREFAEQAGKHPLGKAARELADRQHRLLDQLAPLANAPGIPAARQAAELEKILADSSSLADELDRVVTALRLAKATPDPAAEILERAQLAIKKGHRALDRNFRDLDSAIEARRVALAALIVAASEAAAAVPTGPGTRTDPVIRAAAEDARTAQSKMREVIGLAGRSQPTRKPVQEAADALTAAANRLREIGESPPTP